MQLFPPLVGMTNRLLLRITVKVFIYMLTKSGGYNLTTTEVLDFPDLIYLYVHVLAIGHQVFTLFFFKFCIRVMWFGSLKSRTSKRFGKNMIMACCQQLTVGTKQPEALKKCEVVNIVTQRISLFGLWGYHMNAGKHYNTR